MERLRLSDQEVTHYFNVFEAHDTEKQGKLRSCRVVGLLHQAGLSSDLIHKILELSGSGQQGYFGRTQFFLILKFVALAQADKDISWNSLRLHGRKLPFPRFDTPTTPKSDVAEAASRLRSDLSHTGNAEIVVDQLGTLSEISTHLSTASPEKLHLMSAHRFAEDFQADYAVEGNDRCLTDKYAHFEDDDTALLANDHVSREDVDPIDQCTTAHPDSEYNDDYDTDRHLLLGSDSSDVEANCKCDFTGNQWAAFDKSSLTDPVRGNQSSRPSNPADDGQLIIGKSHIRPHENERASGFRLRRFYRSKNNTTASSMDDDLVLGVTSPHSPSHHHHRRWLTLFTLHPKRESEYATQFENLFPADCAPSEKMVSLSDVQHLFLTQFGINVQELEQIWRLADLDRDNRLNKAEFCLASHLSHLHGNKGLSIEDAVSATASYIAKHMPGVHDPSGLFFDNITPSPVPSSTNYHASPDILDSKMECPLLLKPNLDGIDADDEASLLDSRGVPTEADDCRVTPRPPLTSHCLTPSEKLYTGSSYQSTDSTSSITSSSTSETSSSDSDSGSGGEFSCLAQESHGSTNGRLRIHRNISPAQLISITSGQRLSKLNQYSSDDRRRLMLSLIRNTKNANHAILRLNNEMQSEWTDLKDQRINLSAQLQHLGLQPP